MIRFRSSDILYVILLVAAMLLSSCATQQKVTKTPHAGANKCAHEKVSASSKGFNY
jgi:PBP1b-binding outer membrane lipoprotein LpoB